MQTDIEKIGFIIFTAGHNCWLLNVESSAKFFELFCNWRAQGRTDVVLFKKWTSLNA